MNNFPLRSTALALSVAACADGATTTVEPDYAGKWYQNVIVVEEEVVNPCSGQTMHLTSRFAYADAFDANGRQQSRMTVAGTGFSDDGTQFTVRSLARASAVPYESEQVWIHEQVTGSAPGTSYRRKVLLHFHLDGTGEIHEFLDERQTCL